MGNKPERFQKFIKSHTAFKCQIEDFNNEVQVLTSITKVLTTNLYLSSVFYILTMINNGSVKF